MDKYDSTITVPKRGLTIRNWRFEFNESGNAIHVLKDHYHHHLMYITPFTKLLIDSEGNLLRSGIQNLLIKLKLIEDEIETLVNWLGKYDIPVTVVKYKH